MLKRTLWSWIAAAAIAAAGGVAGAAEIKVLTAGAYKPVLQALQPDFEQRSGHRLVLVNDTAGALAQRIRGGEDFDLAVLPPAAIAGLADTRRLAPGAGQPLARVAIGVAVAAGAPRPDISTVEAFKQALRAAPKVAYIDPA